MSIWDSKIPYANTLGMWHNYIESFNPETEKLKRVLMVNKSVEASKYFNDFCEIYDIDIDADLLNLKIFTCKGDSADNKDMRYIIVGVDDKEKFDSTRYEYISEEGERIKIYIFDNKNMNPFSLNFNLNIFNVEINSFISLMVTPPLCSPTFFIYSLIVDEFDMEDKEIIIKQLIKDDLNATDKQAEDLYSIIVSEDRTCHNYNRNYKAMKKYDSIYMNHINPFNIFIRNKKKNDE